MSFQAQLSFEFLLVAFTTIFGLMYNVKMIVSANCRRCHEPNLGYGRLDRMLIVSYAFTNVIIICGEFFVFFIITDSFAFQFWFNILPHNYSILAVIQNHSYSQMQYQKPVASFIFHLHKLLFLQSR